MQPIHLSQYLLHFNCTVSPPVFPLSSSRAVFLPGSIAVSYLVPFRVAYLILLPQNVYTLIVTLVPRLISPLVPRDLRSNLLTIIAMPMNIELPYVQRLTPGSLLILDLKFRQRELRFD